jgi:preprotein translocase subunit SecA
MLSKVVKTIFGDPNERAIKQHWTVVHQINAFEAEMQALSDAQLRAKTEAFKGRFAQGETLDDLLPEAYALVREASRRAIGLRHYDVQMIGGIVLHRGQIAEMRTGEGKTLVATLPIYLNALSGQGVHLVTPNDYLSKVGVQQMGPVYHFLGLTTAVIQNQGAAGSNHSFMYDPDYHSEDDRYEKLRPINRREAYYADITYGTNNEFGFDYLRDNMVRDTARMAQRELNFAIVDEIDNILIDEARTPLIISGQASQPSDLYSYFARLVRPLKPSSYQSMEDKEPDGDYVFEEKDRIVYLTDAGVEKLEAAMRREGRLQGEQLYSSENSDMIPYLDNSLRAMVAYELDKQYVVMEGEVIIVDEFTGRLMHGRRFSEGLHQAIEAKEGVQVRSENVTMATITFQNYFRMYKKLGGMTGTAITEAAEFEKIYNLEVTMIPTHRPVVRQDHEDQIYRTEKGKFMAVVADIKERHQRGQPVLVGTVAIETSERLAKLLDRAGVPHEVLNAKQHFKEANIITQAGRPGAVTIATNMAGRGVDILLGGNPEGLAREILRKRHGDVAAATPEQREAALAEARAQCERDKARVIEAGGLYVLGTERHEARRIDNQLRGRSGRQGDPGESRFYLSLEDDLMRRFGGDQVRRFMEWAEIPEDQPIENGLISKSIQQAQVRVEGYNFDIRKRVLEYDDVVNKQREDIYGLRRRLLTAAPDELREQIQEMIAQQIHELCQEHLTSTPDDEDLEQTYREALVFRLPSDVQWTAWRKLDRAQIETEILKGALRAYDVQIETNGGPENMARVEREVYMQIVDEFWVRHLTDLSVLREGIGLQGLRGRDPLVEYKIEGFQLYNAMKAELRAKVARMVYHVQLVKKQEQRIQNIQAGTVNMEGATATNAKAAPEPIRASERDRLGRNDPCWCGSGKKYKSCHYAEDQRNRQTVPQEMVKGSRPTRRR